MRRVVFVHGACVEDGSWWWHRTGELLAERGVTSEAPVLPSCGKTGEKSAARQQVPSTYLVCAQDRGTAADRQRDFAGRAGSVVELDAGHHPFLSRPGEVRDLILST